MTNTPLEFIVNFHGIGEPGRELEVGESSVWTSLHEMEQILDLAAENGRIKFTCDDGNSSDYVHLLPALASRGLSCTFFVITDRIGRRGSLSKSQLLEMKSAGMKIGLHGKTHRSWRSMTPDVCNQELVLARSQLEDMVELRIEEAACPFGQYDRTTVRELRKLGYKAIYTSDGGWHRAGQLLVPRNSVRQGRKSFGSIELRLAVGKPAISVRDRLRRSIKPFLLQRRPGR